jgi:alpha-tubulin suppressor-like RCC1 family protein
MVISDAAHGSGNPHFYFKPPMVPSTTYRGTFDPTLDVTVKICEWSAAGCVAEVASFTMNSAAGSETVRVDPGEEHYIVNWHTSRFTLNETRTYRIRVLAGGYELGYADVDLYRSKSEAKKSSSGTNVAFKHGATLPIKFRIESGALPAGERRLVSGGQDYTCALSEDGSAWCWGSNWNGQLGNGGAYRSGTSREYYDTPQPVVGGHSFVSISAGLYHACALKADGSAWCWGAESAGKLGNGRDPGNGIQPNPVQVLGGHRFVELDVEATHSCGRTREGTLWCWGSNVYGGLGDGSTVHRSTPVQVRGTYKSVAVGEWHTCAIGEDGITYCWGSNFGGELGNGQSGFHSGSVAYQETTPQPISTAFTQVEAGGTHTCALTADGAAYCWGYNPYGELGRGYFTNSASPYAQPTPAPVSGSHRFSKLTLGRYHSCGLKADGSAYCWGKNEYGQLGIGTATPASPYGVASPQPVPGTWAALGAGYVHTCGITPMGAGKCWGWNGWSQLGRSADSDPHPTPLDVSGGLTFATP